MNLSLLKYIIKEELANKLKEATHPWYISADGYYKGTNPPLNPPGPVHTGNVSQYLKPNVTVYNNKGESKTIKTVSDSHLQFSDGTEDYFKNWFPQKPINEESATGAIGVGAGPIMTPYAFAKKGQKTNKATQTAMKQGFKKASGMPKNSKMFDYKELWPGKKSAMNEVLTNIIKEELLNETSYNKFKNEVKYRTKNEMLHKSIREVKRKLEEVERLVEYTTRIKQELSENEEGVSYWKRSLKAINEISEVSNKISNKIKSIYQ
jgi:hypothetical protein